MSSLIRIVLVVAVTSFSACGGPDALVPTIELSKTEATLLKRGTKWSLSAPVRANLGAATASFQLVARVEPVGAGSFLLPSQDPFNVPAGAASLEVPLSTTGNLPTGVETRMRLTVSVFASNGAAEIRNATASADYVFVGN